MRSGARSGDLIFFCADRSKIVDDALGALRSKIGHDRGYAQAGWKPLWVIDFPMFEYDEQNKTWGARHHPFTAPKDGHENLFEEHPGQALAKAYDVVCNGTNVVATATAQVPVVTGYSPPAVKQKKTVTILGSAFTGNVTIITFSFFTIRTIVR